jgi:hypothetical protein
VLHTSPSSLIYTWSPRVIHKHRIQNPFLSDSVVPYAPPLLSAYTTRRNILQRKELQVDFPLPPYLVRSGIISLSRPRISFTMQFSRPGIRVRQRVNIVIMNSVNLKPSFTDIDRAKLAIEPFLDRTTTGHFPNLRCAIVKHRVIGLFLCTHGPFRIGENEAERAIPTCD